MKAYLDNNIVSAIVKDDTATESAALDKLLAAADAGKIDVVTSPLTLQELKLYKGPLQKALERTFLLLQKVPLVPWDELVGMHNYGDARTWITSPLTQNDPLYDNLLKIGLDSMDARHVFVAATNRATLFSPATAVSLREPLRFRACAE